MNWLYKIKIFDLKNKCPEKDSVFEVQCLVTLVHHSLDVVAETNVYRQLYLQ